MASGGNGDKQKRTLKSVYKLLKRDIKALAVQTDKLAVEST